MICEKCIDREDCRIRPMMGKHSEECKSFFPDLLAEVENEDRTPSRIRTPEDRRKPIQTRD